MKKIIALALALAGLCSAAPAFAQDWRVSAISGTAPSRAVYLLDAASIVRKGDTVTFTTQSIFEQPTSSGFDRSITKRSGSCTAMSSRIVENSYYGGGQFQNTAPGGTDAVVHSPGSVMRDTLEQVCGTKAISAERVADPEPTVRAYFRRPS